jgi:hypothetical protein
MNSVDHLANVGKLQSLDARVERQDLVVNNRGNANVIDVVGYMEGMPPRCCPVWPSDEG